MNKTPGSRVPQGGTLLYHAVDRLLPVCLVAGLVVFILYPLLCMTGRSVVGTEGVSVAAYETLFRDGGKLLGNSLFVAVLTALFSTLIGVAVALRVHFSGHRLRKGLTALLLMTMVSPPFIGSLAYIQLFGRRGAISHGLLGLSLNPYGAHGIIAMESLFFAAQTALLLLGTLRQMDTGLLAASADLGATPSRTVLRVVLPVCRPAVLVCFLLSLIRSLSDFGTPMVIGGRFNTLATEIYMQMIGYGDLQKAAAMNVLLMVPAILVFAVYRRLMKRNGSPFSVGKTDGAVFFRLGGVANWLITAPAALFFGMMVLQYGSIFLGGFLKSIRGVPQFTLDHFGYLFAYNAGTLVRSVVYALIVAVVGTLFGILLAYYIERRRMPLGGLADCVATLPYMLPGTCFGIGYLLAFHGAPLKLTGTAAIVVLNMVFRQLPITTKAASAALAQLPERLEWAGRDLGAHPVRVLTDVVLPNLKPAFTAGFVTNFTAAMTTVGSVLFLIDPGQKIAVFTLFDAVNSGEYGVASLISSCIILITIAVNGLFLAVTNGKGAGARVFRTGKSSEVLR